jgi:catechol 2,3-dioxygenase-like lactoylglutathione lyase family enzyme
MCERGKETAMKLSANGWSHLGLRVTDLARAKRFYVDTLGCPLVRETEQAVFVNVSGMLIALLGADAHTPRDDHFDPFRVGLDHLALAVENPSKLEDMQRDLDAAGVRNNGVEEDPVTHRKYISFYDPDDIAWELYSVSPRPTA